MATSNGTQHTDQPPSGRYGTFASLRYRNYRYLWLGQTAHAAALWMEQIARPWLVLLLTESALHPNGNPVHVGGVVALQTAPQLLFGVWAGVIADWFDRRTILLWTKRLVLTVNVVFAFLLVSGMIELWHVYAVAFLRGTLMSFDQPARQSLIATLVPRELLTNGVALMSSTQNVMRILGVTAAGAVIAFVGIEGTWVVISVVLIGAVVATQLIDMPKAEPAGDRGGVRGMGRDLMEGARFAWSRPEIRGVLLLSLIYFTFGMSYMQVFLPIFARFEFGIGAIGFTILSASAAVGALLGALVIANRRPVRLGRILPTVCAGMGFMLILFAASWWLPRPYDVMMALPLLVVVGLMQTTYFSLTNSTLLTATPEHMRGRVISLLSLDRAMVTGGASLAGFLASALGVQLAQIGYGVVCVLAGLVVLAMAPGLRAYRIDGVVSRPPAGARAAVATPSASGARTEGRPVEPARSERPAGR